MSANTYSCFNTFIYRTPLLPTGFNAGQPGAGLFNDALFISSTDLFDSISRSNGSPKLSDKQQLSYDKYVQRSKYRCTPYGLMAGIGVGTIGNTRSRIVLSDTAAYSRHTRLDMSYMVSLLAELEKNETVRKLVKYFPNSTIYEAGDKLYYYERVYAGGKKTHLLSSVEKDDYVTAVLEGAKTGATFQQLIDIIDDPEIDPAEKEAFIHDIINSQLLESELEPAITGSEMGHRLQQLLETLVQRAGGNKTLKTFCENIAGIHILLREIDNNGIAVRNIELYNRVEELVKELGAPYRKSYLLQTDLNITARSACIHSSLPADVLAGIDAMSRLTPRFDNRSLTKFRKAFYERWQDAEVPVVIALDPERGIGYIQDNKEKNDISPLVDDLAIGGAGSENQKIDVNNRLNHLWFEKYSDAIQHNKYEITLTEKDLAPFKSRLTEMPDTFTTLTSVIAAADHNDPYSKNKILIRNTGGSSSSNVLARFGHANSGIDEFIREMVQKEEALAGDVLLAEIVYLPESRLGNVLLRPGYRNYEIPILCQGSVPRQQQVPIADLTISVRGDRIILKSISLDKEIRPCLTNAHNYTIQSLAVYHFLSDMQTQHMVSAVQIDLGIIELSARFLPRITLNGNIILRQAKWQLTKTDYECLFGLSGAELEKCFAALRAKFNFSRYIALAEADNELVFDTDNTTDLVLLSRVLAAKDAVHLVEFIFDPATALVTNNGQVYTNEIIFSWYRQQAHPDRRALPADKVSVQKNRVQRTFYPGDDWVYFKLYAGNKSSDQLLKAAIAGAVEELLTAKAISKWFFIRYNDPGNHLRVRCLLTDKSAFAVVVSTITTAVNKLAANGLVSRVQIDTYERECERYGYAAIEYAESLFFLDSEAVVKAMCLLDSATWDQWKVFYALKNADLTLQNFGLSLHEKLVFAEASRDAFLREFSVSKPTQLQLDTKFRTVKQPVDYWLSGEINTDADNELVTALADTLRTKAGYIGSIREDLYQSVGKEKVLEWMGSYIHMDMNRIFRSKSRLHELVVYYYLSKYFKNQLGKLKSERKKTEPITLIASI